MKRMNMSKSSSILFAGVMALAVSMQAGVVHAITVGGEVESEASLQGLWKLDEVSGSLAADAAGSNDGTISGGVTLGASSASSVLGNAMDFNGSTGKIVIPFDANLNTNDFTIETFARVDGGAGTFRSPLTSRNSSPKEGYILYAASNNTWQFWSGDGTTNANGWNPLGSVSVVQDQWVHLAGTYDSATNAKVLYMNGAPVATQTPTGYVPKTSNINGESVGIGGDNADAFAFNGAIDNVAIFNTALEHQRIADHYNSYSLYASTVLNDNPEAYWRLGEQAGSTAYNAADVTQHNGTYQNGVAIRQFDTALTGDIDTAADFDGADDRVIAAYNVDLNPVNFSVEAWAKVEGGQNSFRALVTSRDHLPPPGTGQRGFIIYAASNNTWQFWTGDGANNAWDQITGTAIQVDEWAHIVATFEAIGGPDINGTYTGTKSLYINGVLVATAVQQYLQNGASDFFIGAGGDIGTEFRFNGKIDEVALYQRALSAAEVGFHYTVGITGVPEPASATLLLLGAAGLSLRRRRGVA